VCTMCENLFSFEVVKNLEKIFIFVYFYKYKSCVVVNVRTHIGRYLTAKNATEKFVVAQNYQLKSNNN
jgi:hypothetical protein